MAITTRLIPVATATTQELLVEITEKTCRPYCVNSSIQPSASCVFTLGSVKILGGVAIAPVTATVTVVTPSSTGCGCAHTQVFSEQFEIPFEATTASTVTIAAGSSTIVDPSDVKCCKARGVKLTTTLTATIA